ncbi:MAG: hypothetical protein KAY32_15030, partial [Candidatus Eisenbacteria sp.]|nr:hypothetical protein [Candidatus Eisenbacteria bacterium]
FWLLRGRRLSMGAGLAAATLVPLLLWTGVFAAARVPPSPLGAGSDHALRTYRGNYVPDQGWETTGLGDAISPELSAAEEETFGQRGSRGGGEETKERIYWGAFRRTIMRDPLGWAGLVAKKFGLFWTYPARAVVIRSFAGGYAIPRSLLCWLLPLGLVGVACVGGRRDGRWLPGALILAAAGMHALTHLVARYHVPLLPLWFIYGLLGAKAITRSLRDRVRGGGWLRLPWGWLAAGGIALGAGAFLLAPPVDLSRELARPLYLVGALLWGGAGMACVPFCLAAGPRRRAARRRLLPWFWAAGLLFCLPVTGARITEPDWDQFACRLERPGDALRQEIVLPGFLRARGAELLDTWLEIDMLRSLRGNLRLEVWAEGVCLETFRDTLGGTYESFLFDAEIHGAENRHRRLADTNAEFVRGWLNPRHGDQSPGFDYFRRWVTIPLPVGLLERDTLVVELRLTDADDGAWVQVYGDRYVDDDPRTFVGPAMGKNPFEYSHYRVAFLAGDRERMDGRLIRPRRLWSVATRSLRRHAGRWSEDLCPDWRVVKGELRVRARVRVPGRLAGEVNEEGRVVPVWVTGSPEGVTPFGPQEIRRFQWWRDHYFDGTRVL